MSTTPYMNLDLPTPSVTVGPDWATAEVTAFGVVDAHDHSPGKGTKVPAAGLNIDSDLSFGHNKLTSVKSVNLDSQSSSLDASNVQSLYSITGDLWFNNSSGTPVQITQGSSIANSSSPLVPSGVIWAYGGSSAPTGFLMCTGAAVSRTTYSDLFAAIGTTYGTGDGSTTFTLPDMRGRAPVGSGTYTDPVSGSVTRTLGSSLGAEKHQLTLAETPSHNHGGGAHTHSYGQSNANTLQAGSNSAGFTSGGNFATSSSGTIITTQGSDNSHNNMQPSLVTNWIIKT